MGTEQSDCTALFGFVLRKVNAGILRTQEQPAHYSEEQRNVDIEEAALKMHGYLSSALPEKSIHSLHQHLPGWGGEASDAGEVPKRREIILRFCGGAAAGSAGDAVAGGGTCGG